MRCRRRQLFQTISPLKALGRMKPNYMKSLHGVEEQKFARNVWVKIFIYGNIFENLFRNRMANDLEIWYAALVARALSL